MRFAVGCLNTTSGRSIMCCKVELLVFKWGQVAFILIIDVYLNLSKICKVEGLELVI